MKILLLTYPYHSVHYFGKTLAQVMNYDFIQDPMDISLSISSSYWEEDGYHEGVRPRPYIFPDNINDNTIVTHNVKWHKLPGNRTENTFLNDWTGSFDKVIALTTNDLSSSAEVYFTTDYYTNVNNTAYKEFIRNNSGYYRNNLAYQDDINVWDDAKLNKLEECHEFLDNYILYNNITSSVTDDFIGTHITKDHINSVVNTWGLDDWEDISFENSNDKGTILDHCSNWERNMY